MKRYDGLEPATDPASFQELGKRAVACKGWRWMAGMLTMTGRRILANADGAYIATSATALPAKWDDPELPDFTDPATVGCLLALVREVWGDPYLCCVGDQETGWRLDGYAAVDDLHSFRSEAEALVAALEDSP